MTPALRTRPALALAAGGLLGLALTVVGALWLGALADRLPARLAVHWGPGGLPDRYADLVGAVTTAALLTILTPLLLIAVAFAVDRSARSVLAGAAAGLAVFIAAVSFGSLLAQVDTTAPVPVPGLVIALGVLAGVAVGLGVGRLGRITPPALDGPAAPLPPGAETLDVPSTVRLGWVGGANLPGVATTGLLALGVLPLAWMAAVVSPWLWLVAVLVGALLVALTSARVIVDRDGVRVSTLGLSWSRIPLERVASAEVGEVSALGDFGGWGWRIGRDGRRGFVTRSGEALVVHRRGEPDVVVTVDDARGAAAVVNTLAARA